MQGLVEEVWRRAKEAAEILRGVVHETPLDHNATFSRLSGNEIFLKLENMQRTGAFKVRGAYHKIYRVLGEARERGVVAASSGNHAQGVAYASSILGVRATIVMPETTPPFKVEATRSYGAEVVLRGRFYDEAYEEAVRIAAERGSVFVHPFDDLDVISGQATIGLEISRQLPGLDAVLVPVGGGGLIAGVGVAVKRLVPNAKVVAVEPKAAAKYAASRGTGRPIAIEPSPSLADAVVTKGVGELTYKVMEEVVDDVVTVDEESIARAIYMLMERAKTVAEGAGALPLAALLEGYMRGEGKRIALLVSGGNIDLSTVYRVVMRALVAEGRVQRLTVILRDVPGELHRVLEVLRRHRCNVLEVFHDRLNVDVPPGYAKVSLAFEVPGAGTAARVLEELKGLGVLVGPGASATS